MRSLIIVTLILAVSCKAGQSNSAASEYNEANPMLELNSNWVLLKVNGRNVDQLTYSSTPTLVFNIIEKSVDGNNGCNNFFGQLDSIDDKNITIRIIGSTKAFCPEIKNSDMLGQYLNAIRTYKIVQNSLFFYDEAGGEILQYTRNE